MSGPVDVLAVLADYSAQHAIPQVCGALEVLS